MTFEGPSPSDVGDLQERRDRKAIEEVAAGDEDAFADVFRRYGPAALGLAHRICGDQTLAEEVVQEVFVSVWRRAASYDPLRGRVRSWLLTQVHHRAVDVVRREEAERRRASTPFALAVETPTPDDVIEEGWLAARRTQVRAALVELPHDLRRMIEMAYFDGLTQTQVAAKAGVPLGTVKSRTLSAMRRLRDVLRAGEDA
jgi:RNA polymerase sigma-70 factor (ECF subfamily)